MSPALNRSSEIQRLERSEVIEIRNGIIFDFYTGLPRMFNLSYLFFHVGPNNCLLKFVVKGV